MSYKFKSGREITPQEVDQLLEKIIPENDGIEEVYNFDDYAQESISILEQNKEAFL